MGQHFKFESNMNVRTSQLVVICLFLYPFAIVNAFQVVLPQFNRFSQIHLPLQITESRIRIFMAKYDDIDELFQEAMEEDEEWYNSFVRDVLGEDTEILEKSIDVEKEETHETNDAKPNVPMSSDYRKWKIGETEKDTVDERNRVNTTMPDSERSHEAPIDEVSAKKMNTDGDGKLEPSSQEPKDDIIVQYVDMYGDTQRVPYSVLEQLGYKISDLVKIQAEVLELILEDMIPMPKRGIPKRWVIPDPGNKEIVILKKRQKSPRRDETERLSKGQKDRTKVDYNADEKRSHRKLDMSNQPRKRNMRRRDNSRSSNEESDSIWMDIPSFKNYLRREAEFRLSILGPEWEDWVKGESEWRLDLYKKWLDLVEDGYGKDLMDDLYTVPPNERRNPKAKRPKPSIAGKRERPESSIRDRPMRQRPARPFASTTVDRSRRSRSIDEIDDDRLKRDKLYRKTRDNIGRESNFNAIEDYVVGMIEDEASNIPDVRRERGLDDIDSFSDQYSEETLDDDDEEEEDTSRISPKRVRSASSSGNRYRSRLENDVDYRKMNKNRRR
jgi:hypothetical protein